MRKAIEDTSECIFRVKESHHHHQKNFGMGETPPHPFFWQCQDLRSAYYWHPFITDLLTGEGSRVVLKTLVTWQAFLGWQIFCIYISFGGGRCGQSVGRKGSKHTSANTLPSHPTPHPPCSISQMWPTVFVQTSQMYFSAEKGANLPT